MGSRVDSADKRRRALAAIHALEAAGTPITAAAVATAARVSTWLLYTDGLREHLDAARRRQSQPTSSPASTAARGDQGTPPSRTERVSPSTHSIARNGRPSWTPTS